MTEYQERFFSQLNSLSIGERAKLRREAGNLLRQADGKAISVFYRCLPYSVESWQEDRWFAVACIQCMWNPETDSGLPFEQIISDLLHKEELSDSIRHRVELLLDTKWDLDGYMLIKLTRMIKMIRQKSEGTPINFCALLEDLIGWNSETQYVQRKWAKVIFSNINNNNEEKEN